MSWQAIAILPNLAAGRTFDGEFVAIAGRTDPRIQELCRTSPSFADLLDRYSTPFEVPLDPMVLIIRNDPLNPVSRDAIFSFRDIVAISTITHGRNLNTVYDRASAIMWSTYFELHPWTISNDPQYLTTANPAQTGLHMVAQFHGQSSPEIMVMELAEFDEPLFETLLRRWRAHYFGRRKTWADRALFRSLNMAFYASAIPSAVGTSLLDLGRSVSLWVSAFETLSHPGKGKSDLETVYSLFGNIPIINPRVGQSRYAAYSKGSKKKKGGSAPPVKRCPLPCWMYGRLYHARNQFLHGNRVSSRLLDPVGSRRGLFWLAASLYRLALSGFLEMDFQKKGKLPYWQSADYGADPELRKLRAIREHQDLTERALLRIRA